MWCQPTALLALAWTSTGSNVWHIAPTTLRFAFFYNIFCSTDLSLASTQFICTTFSSRCPLSFNQRRWFTAAKVNNFFVWNFFLEMLGIELRAAGSRSMYANHCAILPPSYPPSQTFNHWWWNLNNFQNREVATAVGAYKNPNAFFAKCPTGKLAVGKTHV